MYIHFDIGPCKNMRILRRKGMILKWSKMKSIIMSPKMKMVQSRIIIYMEKITKRSEIFGSLIAVSWALVILDVVMVFS